MILHKDSSFTYNFWRKEKNEVRLQREQTINDIWAEKEEEEFVDSDMEDTDEEVDKPIENHFLNIDENVEEFDIKTKFAELVRNTFENRMNWIDYAFYCILIKIMLNRNLTHFYLMIHKNYGFQNIL